MARNWTNAQRDAIDLRGKTLLVSAAAGSGKTATLTERIIRQISDKNDPSDISKMLIVTFTRAAASELRARIFTALNDALANDPSNKKITAQLLKLGSARISTIDSFYFDLIQSNASALGISSGVRIADNAEYILLAQSVMEKTIDEFYETYEDFPAFVECFSSLRNSSNFSGVLLNIHSKLSSLPEGIEFLHSCAEQADAQVELDFFETSYGQILKDSTQETILHYLNILTDACEFAMSDAKVFECYGEQFNYDFKICNELLNAITTSIAPYEAVRGILLTYAPDDLGTLRSPYSSPESAKFRDLRNSYKKELQKLAKKAFAKSPETIKRALKDTAKHIHTLYSLLAAFEKYAEEEKAKMGILTFTDIRRLVLKLLVEPDGTPTALAKQYAEQFSDIYIDEYQDVDRVQDLIFSSIARSNNRFMVGDIKQSIYAFRGSEPKLFASYRSRFPAATSADAEDSDSVSIFMSDNFRCDENIIKFTNLVCSKIFTAASDSIGYTPEDDLRFSKAKPYEGYISPKVKISIINTPTRGKKTADTLPVRETEAEFIAERIKKLLRDGKKADGSRILPEDIAVLYRNKLILPYISAALKKRGILSTDADAEKYLESPDVLMLLCVLNAIDNPERDTFMAGCLRSPIFDFSLDELIMLRREYDSSASLYFDLCCYIEDHDNSLADKCLSFKNTLEAWQDASVSMPIDRFLRMLFDSEPFMRAGIVSQVKDDGEGGNLLLLYEFARGFERGGFKGLYQFIEYINSMIEKGKSFDMDSSTASKNRVTLSTMHKSKGLEFPVCFICEADLSLRAKESRDSLVFEYPCGVAMKISDESGFARINTPMREALLSKIATKQAEEEMRILYVALTRAREQLYISTVTTKTLDKLFDEASPNVEYPDRYTVIHQCSSYLDWILLSCNTTQSESFEFEVVDSSKIIEAEEAPVAEEASDDACEDSALTERLREKFAFKYSYSELSRVPSKLSVSRLYPDILDENDNSLELFTEDRKADIPDFFLDTPKAQKSSAERGTATHLFLQFCDFAYAKEHGIDEALARLEHKKFLPPNAASMIYTDELSLFLESDFCELILTAKSVIREQRFNVELPVEGFTSNDELKEKMQGEVLAVQGVIDLILIDADGNISLFDYKTDRLTHAELENERFAKKRMNDTHALQLSYYARAVEILYGKPCKRIAVYSTHSAKLYDITPIALVSQNANLV